LLKACKNLQIVLTNQPKTLQATFIKPILTIHKKNKH